MGHMGSGSHMGKGVHGQWDTWAEGHVGNGTPGQRGIMVNTTDRDGAPWGMGHMSDGVHGQWAHGHVLDHVQLP